MTDPRVGRAASALGFAGLLPPLVGLALIGVGRRDRTDLAWIPAAAGYWLVMIYAALILSFLGGIWWGFAMRRGEDQGAAAAVAVVPSLAALGCLGAAAARLPSVSPWAAVTLGAAIIATLPVDRQYAGRGEAPAGWMRLRVPLSLGLGLLTIAAGVLVGVA